MATRADHDRRILDGALRIAARDGWHVASLAAIAAEAGVTLLEMYRRYPSRIAVLAALLDRVDEAVLGESKPDLGEPARDRLFELVMRRFDALRPHKVAVGAIARALVRDPVGLACLSSRLMRSMAWMLEAAGLDSAGWRGALRAKGLGAIYLAGLRAWLADDTADSSRTMAAVDQALRRAEAVITWCSRLDPRRKARMAAEAPTPERPPGAKRRNTTRRRRARR